MYIAAKDGKLEEVKQLLKTTYVDPDPDIDGRTPLIIAGKIFLITCSNLNSLTILVASPISSIIPIWWQENRLL